MPSPAEIEVEEWAAPNGSYSLSARRVKPDRPPSWRSVRMRLAPAGEDLVRIGLVADVPDQPVVRRVEHVMQRRRSARSTPSPAPRCPPVTDTAEIVSWPAVPSASLLAPARPGSSPDDRRGRRIVSRRGVLGRSVTRVTGLWRDGSMGGAGGRGVHHPSRWRNAAPPGAPMCAGLRCVPGHCVTRPSPLYSGSRI